MKKAIILSILAFFATGLSFGQPGTNAPDGSGNYIKSLYGTVQGASRGASDALYFTDYLLQPDSVVDGLVELGFTVTVASDWNDFNAKLASGNYGLAVAFVQNNCGGPSVSTAQTFINGGGCMIYCDWCGDNTFATLFEANYTGAGNLSSVTITDPVLATGITNPVALYNPGWGTFSLGLTAIGSGQVLATFENGNAAIVRGNGGKTVILGYLSDTPLMADRKQLFKNVVGSTLCGNAQSVPVSGWAILLGIFLILSFVVFRYAKAS